MKAIIKPSHLSGDVTILPSKSHGHRLLIAACLSGHPESAAVDLASEDIAATRSCLDALQSQEEPVLDCRESGSTLRFLLPVAAVLKNRAVFLRRGRLGQRTLSPLREEMERHGCTFEEPGDGSDAGHSAGDACPLIVTGPMAGGRFELDGNVSSQFITGLLFALPLTREGGTIEVRKPLASRPYIDLTRSVLRKFRIKCRARETEASVRFRVPGGQVYTPPAKAIAAEGDWSNAAFWIAANTLGAHLHIHGLPARTAQGDRAIEELAANLALSTPDDVLTVDAGDIPDLVPILSVMAWRKNTGLVITNAGRLRDKESDRLRAMCENLTALGAAVEETPDGLAISPVDPARHFRDGAGEGGPVSVKGYNDHRIVMSMAIAGTVFPGGIEVDDAQAVAKSYPEFFDVLASVGGKAVLLSDPVE